MKLLLLIALSIIPSIIAPDGNITPSHTCGYFDDYNSCKKGEYASEPCAWCYSSNSCCGFDICDNKTKCNCVGKFDLFTDMNCEDYKKQQQIGIIVASIVGGILGLVVICVCICCYFKRSNSYGNELTTPFFI